jgi:hypothetical protein
MACAPWHAPWHQATAKSSMIPHQDPGGPVAGAERLRICDFWLLFYHVTFGSIFSDLLVRLPDDMKLPVQPTPKRREPLLTARETFRKASIVWISSIHPRRLWLWSMLFFHPCLSHHTTSSRSSNNRRPGRGPRVGPGFYAIFVSRPEGDVVGAASLEDDKVVSLL